MRILITATLSLTLSLGLISGAAASKNQVYRWTDAKGQVHYSDKPPADAQFDRVKIRDSAPASDTDPATAAATAQSQGNNTPAGTPAPRPDQAEKDAQRAERCKTAQRNLAALRSELDVEIEADGQKRLLNPEERLEQISRNEKAVALNCETP